MFLTFISMHYTSVTAHVRIQQAPAGLASNYLQYKSHYYKVKIQLPATL